MSIESTIEERIDAAADAVGSAWPLHSFVTANPLAGFEERPFHEAVTDAKQLLGADGYPSADVFRRAWESGRIDPDILSSELAKHGHDADPESSLDRLETAETATTTTRATTATDRVDAVLTKWLSAFLDQGQADWPMPNRDAGFYDAFRTIAPIDGDIPDADASTALPEQPIDAIRDSLASHPTRECQDILEFQLAALPGWTGYIKQRATGGSAWQSAHPITLRGYLAVRLTLVGRFDAPLAPAEARSDGKRVVEQTEERVPRAEIWLTAWEATHRSELLEALTEASAVLAETRDGDRPDTQLVFCIDTRSEIIRRHVEAAGNHETHGYAGFFGIPMRHVGHGVEMPIDACPPILDAQHRITDRPTRGCDANRETHDRWERVLEAGAATIKRLSSNAATAFSFVESTGVGYGAALAARTLFPARVHDLIRGIDEHRPDAREFCEPSIDHDPDSSHELPKGLTLEEKVEYAATAFELMGWEQFARVVVFVGHASRTTNNPFDSSLDCGACAGNPGGPSARVLATICNEDVVKTALRERGVDVPEDTVFVAGEHNTTTDEVELHDSHVPASHETDIEQLRTDLATARAGAAAERAGDLGATVESGVRETERRAADWAETRPEWGLAGNASFVIGPRALTDGLDLDGRSFLHSHDWRTDPDGDALEAILTGPMVVTQWINSQYYFATVDNAVHGSGSKTTHNPVGNIGVYQGNGGDLMTGLPRQSLMTAADEPYHQPLRLSTIIHAPVERVTEILAANKELTGLLDNNWLSLTVIDPRQDHRAFQYTGELTWTPLSERIEARQETRPLAIADD